MGDEDDAAARSRRFVNEQLEAAGRTVDQGSFWVRWSQIRSRSTMRPFWRCSSMISSMSLWST